MITVDLNEHKEAGSCGEIARQLIKTGSDPDQAIRFYRGKTSQINSPIYALAAIHNYLALVRSCLRNKSHMVMDRKLTTLS